MGNNDHISTAEVRQDIADTLAEIATMEREEKGFTLVGDKMSLFRAAARRDGIRDRTAFVERLKTILLERGEATSDVLEKDGKNG